MAMPALVVDDELVYFFDTQCRRPRPSVHSLTTRRETGHRLDGTASIICLAIHASRRFPPAIHIKQALSPHLPQLAPEQTGRHPLPPHLAPSQHPHHQVDPLLFPPELPINPSLFRWCKWRPHQHHPPRSCRCSVHSLPAARTWSPPWTAVWDGARYQSRGWIDGIYFGGMGRGGPFFFPLLFSRGIWMRGVLVVHVRPHAGQDVMANGGDGIRSPVGMTLFIHSRTGRCVGFWRGIFDGMAAHSVIDWQLLVLRHTGTEG